MHKDFRLFFCMNPPYTSAAKKQLPWEIRQRVTEVYVDELDKESDIWMIIDKKAGKQISEHNYSRKILEFYMKIRGGEP
jgi:midasin (ATPase involved in ribosome maturation)